MLGELLFPLFLLAGYQAPRTIDASAQAASAPSTAPESNEITAARSETGLAYELRGEGPVVVLIHGSNLDQRMWDDEVEWLEDKAQVLRYDLRGQGTSRFPSTAYSNHTDLLELLDELEVSRASLVGLSSGAQVALDVALTAPERVRRLVLVSPSLAGYVPEETPPFFAELIEALREGDFASATEVLLASPVMRVPDEYASRVRTMVEENERLWTIPFSLVRLLTPPALERLGEIRVPTLVLVGQNDLVAVSAQGELLQEQLTDAELVVVPDGGHLLNMTSPEAFRTAVGDFLDPE